MKKLLLLPLFCLFATTLFAQKIRVYNGKLDPIATETQIAVKFTYDDMQVGKLREVDYLDRKVADYNKKEPGCGDNWLLAWVADRESRFEPKFLELFAKYMMDDSKNGGIALIPESTQTKYLFHVNTFFTEPGFNIGIARQNAAISLEINVIDRETDERIARLIVENASANDFLGTDFDTGYRIQECYAKAGRELAKYFIKTFKL